MADRIVVMNHGVIEQVGTPEEIYRRPASRFVADFVGKMNFLPAVRTGADEARVGDVRWTVPHAQAADGGNGEPVTLGFRPEEICFRHVSEQQPNSHTVKVGDIEFLGATWRTALTCPALGDAALIADFSSDDARTLGLHTGQSLRVAVAPEHVHVFPGGVA